MRPKEHITILHISQKQLDKYKALCKEIRNIELTDQEAMEGAAKLIILYKAIYKPITKDMFQRLKQRDAEYIQEALEKAKKKLG